MEASLDTLEVIKKAERMGGTERRESIEKMLLKARDLGCEMRIGGGRAGGMNIRYGSIGYAVMDVNTKGTVKLYVQPHPNKNAPEEFIDTLNGYIDESDQLEPKSSPINSYGHLEDKIEEIDDEAILNFLEKSVGMIRDEYYRPHFEAHEMELLEI